MSLYTAQMAAHLTAEALVQPISSMEDALEAGFRFCGERKAVDSIMKAYKNEHMFATDPVDEGGKRRVF